MLRVLINSPSFELRERARDAVLRMGCYAVEDGAADLCVEIDAAAVERGIPTLRCDAAGLEAAIVPWLQQHAAHTVADVHPIPRPPALYAVPPYALTYKFIGRRQELLDLDAWAASNEPAMVYEAIGGMGKSALAWEWLQHHADAHIPGLAGKVWWSFYERGSSVRGFVRHALAYVTEQDEEVYRNTDDWEVTRALVDALRERRFLLVLDGFERILAAYHHLDKAQIRDDRIEEDLRQCTNPLDAELVRYLVNCAPSKILFTSRLMPKALEGLVRHHALTGLTPRDAESLARAAGVKGTASFIQDFAALFGSHALVLRVVCGMVNDYAAHPGFFDDWLGDPEAGGALRLEEVDPKHRNAHILEFAIAGLNAKQRQLLARIAVLSDTASYETICVISPYASIVELHAALKTLGERGLVQWDQQANTYDLHPAVRGVAFEQLEHSDRAGTYKALRDHFAAMPPEDYKRATELDHLKNSIEVFRLLIGAGMLKEAASHYFGELANSLMYSVGAYGDVVELLEELLHAAGEEPWKALGARPASYMLGALSIALSHTGEVEKARALEAQTIALDLAERDWVNLSIEIRNLSLGRGLATGIRGLELSLELAKKAGNASGEAIAHLSLAHADASCGRYDEAKRLLEKFRAYPTPGRTVYQRGDAEVLAASIALEEGTLTEAQLAEGEAIARTANNLAGQKEFYALRARWEIARENLTAALAAADAAVEIVRRTGERAGLPYSLRALALARLGRAEEAREALGQASNTYYSAEACFELGYTEAAKTVAIKAYVAAWDDGPPYSYAADLERCRWFLKVIGEDVPELPAFDTARVEKLPHEDEIRAAVTAG